jgi:hypothetical protein
MVETNNSGELAAAPPPTAAATHLPGRQKAALELLLEGKSMSETARGAGVSRTTIYMWLNRDPAFKAAYNQWHDEMEQSARSRLLMLTDKAADAVGQALEGGDAKTAMQLLKGLGFLSPSPPRLTDAQEIKDQTALESKRRRVERECEDQKLDTDKTVAEAEFNAFADKADALRGETR